jgi:hypothetical protein
VTDVTRPDQSARTTLETGPGTVPGGVLEAADEALVEEVAEAIHLAFLERTYVGVEKPLGRTVARAVLATPALAARLATTGTTDEPAVARVLALADRYDAYATECEADVELQGAGLVRDHWRREASSARTTARRIRAALAAQQPQPVVQAFHGDDPARPARDDDPVHDQDGDTSEEGPRG